MKNRNYIYIAFIAVGILLCFSCEKWIDPAVNVNPDSPVDPPMEVILPAIQGRIAYHTGNYDVTGTVGMWMQQINGTARQAQIVGNYTFVSSDVANLWNSFYRDAMMDLSIVIDKSKEAKSKSPHYEGIAKILLAYDLGLATQLWGDVPYTEAWQGVENKHPKYDPQSEIYGTLQTLLDEAIVALQVSPSDNIFNPANGDLIYKGELTSWLKAARALKARFALHTSKRNSNAYQEALDFIADGAFESNDDDFQFNFGPGDTEANPLYQFDEQREDAGQSSNFTNFIESNNLFIVGADTFPDPRQAVFQTKSTKTGIKTFGAYFGQKDAPIHFITYVEQLFIMAEAYYHTQKEQAAKDTLLSAISASLAKFEVNNPNWFAQLSAKISPLTGQNLLTEIMNQKYIALFLQPEVFVDWRRTGIPSLSPATGTEIPRRFPYSIEERNFNRKIPNVTSIYARNWIDVK